MASKKGAKQRPRRARGSAKTAKAKTPVKPVPSMEALKDFVRSRGAEFLKDPNISSVGIGYKTLQKQGKKTRDIAIQFTVETKAVPEVLEAMGTAPIPASFAIDGVQVPTDVVQRKFAADFRLVAEAKASERKARLDPIVPGISVANVRETAGTIGCVVYDGIDGTPYILSNWHVLNGPAGVIGDDIVQPGPFDDNRTQKNRLGKLVRSHVGHAGDCAVATIEDRAFASEIIDLKVAVEKLGEPELDDKVIKSGRTTGVTHGIVTRVHTIAKIDYGQPVGVQEVGGFEIGIDPDNEPEDGEVSKGGDSGSVWLFKAKNGKPGTVLAGLHFAGEGPGDPNEHAVACYPKSVFEKLGITVAPPAACQGDGHRRLFTRIPLKAHRAAETLSGQQEEGVYARRHRGAPLHTLLSGPQPGQGVRLLGRLEHRRQQPAKAESHRHPVHS